MPAGGAALVRLENDIRAVLRMADAVNKLDFFRSRTAARRGARRYIDLSLATRAVASPIALGFTDSAVPPFGTLNWMVK